MRYFLFFILILGVLGLVLSFNGEKKVNKVEESFLQTSKEEPIMPVRVFLAGDIMTDRGVRNSVEKNFEGSYSSLFSNIKEIDQADIAFANLEGPVAGETIGERKGSKFSFRMHPDTIPALAGAGFDVVSFANNHVGDYGTEAFLETLRLLKENNIYFSGAGINKNEARKPVIKIVRGLKVGFISFSDVGPTWMEAGENTPGQLVYKKGESEEIIKQAKSLVDVLFVAIHFGNEYSPTSVRQKDIARSLVDAGADIIVGQHAHVMQEIEWYKEKPIFYGMGNFIFDQYFSPHTMKGMIAIVQIDVKTKRLSGEYFITDISRQFQPKQLRQFDSLELITEPLSF